MFPAVTEIPFHRVGNHVFCIVRGSNKDNEFFACSTCYKQKPKTASDCINAITGERFK